MIDKSIEIIQKSKIIILDFDGVILDTVNIKGECFYDIYKKYDENIAQKVLTHHIDNGGMSRFEKFKYYHKKFLNIDLSEKDLKKMCKDFSLISINKILQSKEIPGAIDFIKNNFNKKILYICSAAPKKDLVFILKNLNLIKYFKEIYGSPVAKRDNLIKIIDLNKGTKICFIGDSINDYSSSKNLKLNFVGLGDYFKKNKLTDLVIDNFKSINNLS